MWTTCPRCRGSGLELILDDDGRVLYEDDCTLCHGDGGVFAGWDEDDADALDDVDVKDED